MNYTDIPVDDCRTGDEGAMLLFALDRVHRQFAWKSGGLSSEQLGTRHPPSGVTVAGTMVHLAKVEEMWTADAAGREPGPPVVGLDGLSRYDAEWQEAPKLAPEELYELWYSTIARCRKEWTGLIANGGLDVHCSDDPGYVVSRRRRLIDILEENLLHTGCGSSFGVPHNDLRPGIGDTLTVASGLDDGRQNVEVTLDQGDLAPGQPIPRRRTTLVSAGRPRRRNGRGS